MVPVLQQDLENGLDVCWYSSWIQHEMPFCNTPHKCFSAFQLAKNDRTHNYHWVIQPATIQALTCHLKRKESALHALSSAERSLYLGKLEAASKGKKYMQTQQK